MTSDCTTARSSISFRVFFFAAVFIFGLLSATAVQLISKPHSAFAGTDTYPSQWAPPVPQDSVLDTWKEYNRECTSYAAWMLHSVNGFEMPFNDNASGWGTDATNDGYTVNMSPKPGSIYWTSSPQHVAWVESVSSDGNTVTVEDYNYANTGVYDEHTYSTSSASGYIHFKDLNPPTVGTSTSFSPYFDSARQTGLMFLHQMSTGGANVYTYNGDNSFSGPGVSTQPFLNSLGWNWSQMQVATGDGNGDGYSDLFMLHKTSDGGANLYEFNSSSGSFNNINVTNPTPNANFPGSTYSWSNMKLLVGDFDGDGKSDVMILSKASDGGLNINIYPAFINGQNNNWATSSFNEHLLFSAGWDYNYMKFAVGDAENDGISDLFLLFGLSSGNGGANFYELKGGSGNFIPPASPTKYFYSSPDGWYWSHMKMLTGDFNGDSHGDIMILYGLTDGSTNMYIFNRNSTPSYSGPGYIEELANSPNGWNWNYMKVATGDVNNDGISDLTMLHKTGDGGANFYVFYGGSGHFAIPSSPTTGFPSPYVWSEMLGPVWNNMDSPN